MLNRFIAFIGFILIVINTGITTGIVFAQQQTASSNTNITNLILSGLWAGSNFDLSGGNDIASNRQAGAQSLAAVNNSTATDTARTSGIYAALGDSVAAGAGLHPSSASASDLECGRSSLAYPYTVAQALKKPLLHIACSGSTMGDLLTEQTVAGLNIQPQLDAAFAHGTPSLITITSGANDVHWINFLKYCYTNNCNSLYATALFNTYKSLLQAKTASVLNSIQQRSGDTPSLVIVTGYYNPLSSRCTMVQQQIDAGESAWINSSLKSLNTSIKNSIKNYTFARFAPVNFSGHDICATDPWAQNIVEPAPFHPNVTGQHVIADSIIDALD
jgi:lysophospholipase L1-like esterase